MRNARKISSVIFTIVFLLLTVVMGFMSMKNLIKFYVNDEVDYNEWSADLGNQFETDIATTFFGKFQFVNLNGAMRNFLGQQEMNGIVKLNNGYLLTPVPYASDEYLQSCTDHLAALNRYLECRGTELVYAATPYTSGKYDPQLPEGVEDYGNDNIDRLMAMLKRAGIDTIDFRETMHEDEINHYSMMYKTDHHWNTKAGFYAYGILEDYITSKMGCRVDEKISNIDHYTVTTYENWHLGSRGQRTGRYYAGIDDFDLIVPDFETIIQNDKGTIGTVQELMINMEPLSNRQYTSRYTYDYVLRSLGHYVNLNCENDVKLLIISDSFSRAVNPYLLMAFSEIEYVYDLDVSSITPEYIESYDPDVVILLYYSAYLYENGTVSFNFQGF